VVGDLAACGMSDLLFEAFLETVDLAADAVDAISAPYKTS